MLLCLLFQEGLNCKAFPAILRFYWDVLNSLRDRPTIVRKGSEVSRCFQVRPFVIVRGRFNCRMLMAWTGLESLLRRSGWFQTRICNWVRRIVPPYTHAPRTPVPRPYHAPACATTHASNDGVALARKIVGRHCHGLWSVSRHSLWPIILYITSRPSAE